MGERKVLNAIGDAIADIRSTLIDRGWFGQEARIRQQWNELGYKNDEGPSRFLGPEHFVWPEGSKGHEKYGSFERDWAPREPAERAQQNQDIEIDR
ncbi:hypothetical protein [Caulobacter mirabilis]|uniref:Uncharacterized protein n=1 Tax=Caulobacter mirabilis TaxID=69666 RepID=A0A2D2AYP1_9CAUL|nr:hypothetical protein [Caulobacter mirabilis]ATQ43130.1 hypothetical protein CSW64_12245 [Caulobacter mirabilis]